ncbi:non-ribosomal peptide synthetase, partial [Fibrella aquatilis]
MKNPFTSKNIKDIYGLSPMQEGMLFHALLGSSPSAYVNQISYRLEGTLHVELVQQSLQRLMDRYDVLRTIFDHKKADAALQVVLKEREADFRYHDLRKQTPDQQVEFLAVYKQQDRQRGFDLGRDMLMRMSLLQLADNQYELMWTHHHILMDGWCADILISEYNQFYAGLCQGQLPVLPPPVPYRRYIDWLGRQDVATSLAYWQDYLAGYDQPASLPTATGVGLAGATAEGYEARELDVTLTETLSQGLAELAVRQRATLSTLVQCVWGLLLGRYCDRSDVVFGAVVSGRPPQVAGIEGMVGLCINTVPVRVRAAASLGFVAWLAQSQQLASGSEAHHYCSLAQVQAQSGLGASLLDHILIFENFPLTGQLSATDTTNGAATGSFQLPVASQVEGFSQTNYPLNLIIFPGPALSFRFSYDARVYTETALRRTADQLVYLFEQVLADPHLPLSQLDLLPPAQREALLALGQGVEVAYPDGVGLHELVARQAAQSPAAVALSWAGGQWSYAQLAEAVAALSARLSGPCGVAPGDRVGLLSGASPWRIAGLLAILTSGGVAVPLAANLPPARLAHIVADAGVALVLVDEASLSALLPDSTPQLLLTNGHEPNQAAVSFTAPPAPNHPSLIADSGAALAYLIYTSGSSGPPKAVAIRHRSLVHRALYHIDYLDLTAHDAVLQFSSAGFDAFLIETFMALLVGGRLVLLEEITRNDLPALVAFLAQQQVNLAILPPAYLRLLVGQELGSLHTLISTGEAASLEASLTLAANRRVYNGYGPTESCIGASFHRVDPDRATAYRQAGGIPIGRPFANTTVYVLDSQGRMLPRGVAGELWVGGIGLAAGYWEQPDLTAERFVEQAVANGQRLYRTGDQVRWTESGELVYEGRLDGQVQVRGMRVELGEIESVLLRGAGVAQAAVVQTSGSGQLVGYLTGTITPADTNVLLATLGQTLPAYMVPAQLLVLDDLPLTANGKLDRQALANRSLSLASAQEPFSAPQGEVEVLLAGAWASIL